MSQRNVPSSEVLRATLGMFRLLTWKGLASAAVLPGLGLMLYYGLVALVRVELGGWPNFNDRLPTRFLSVYADDVYFFAGLLIGSLYVVPFLFIVCLCFRRLRRLATYILAHVAFVGLAIGCAALAPHAFLNWFLD